MRLAAVTISSRNAGILSVFAALAVLSLAGCKHPQQSAAGGFQMPPGGIPVKTETLAANPMPLGDTYVATIKSRRSATINPQVDGNLVAIDVHSGEHVAQGQVLMQIDPFKQRATVDSAAATQQQNLAVYQYNQSEVERQRKLFEAGITSRDAYDQALQSFRSAKANFESSKATTSTQKQELGYYTIRAPFAGVIGDVPVHIGDYVSATTVLTTDDASTDLEAYIYIPTTRASELHPGLPVNILGADGKTVESTKVDFISPQVDNNLQSILVKAPVHAATSDLLRNQQLINAQVIWSDKPVLTVPVLAVTALGGENFVFVAKPAGPGKYIAHEVPVQLGDTVGNVYTVNGGLQAGDKLIVSGTQILQDGMPVHPLG
jgi:RND family efflux transporter MFP subunit